MHHFELSLPIALDQQNQIYRVLEASINNKLKQQHIPVRGWLYPQEAYYLVQATSNKCKCPASCTCLQKIKKQTIKILLVSSQRDLLHIHLYASLRKKGYFMERHQKQPNDNTFRLKKQQKEQNALICHPNDNIQLLLDKINTYPMKIFICSSGDYVGVMVNSPFLTE